MSVLGGPACQWDWSEGECETESHYFVVFWLKENPCMSILHNLKF